MVNLTDFSNREINTKTIKFLNIGQFIKHSFNQQLMYPDELAYELNLIPTREKISQQSKNKYVLYVRGLGLMLGISLATYMYYQKE